MQSMTRLGKAGWYHRTCIWKSLKQALVIQSSLLLSLAPPTQHITFPVEKQLQRIRIRPLDMVWSCNLFKTQILPLQLFHWIPMIIYYQNLLLLVVSIKKTWEPRDFSRVSHPLLRNEMGWTVDGNSHYNPPMNAQRKTKPCSIGVIQQR